MSGHLRESCGASSRRCPTWKVIYPMAVAGGSSFVHAWIHVQIVCPPSVIDHDETVLVTQPAYKAPVSENRTLAEIESAIASSIRFGLGVGMGPPTVPPLLLLPLLPPLRCTFGPLAFVETIGSARALRRQTLLSDSTPVRERHRRRC